METGILSMDEMLQRKKNGVDGRILRYVVCLRTYDLGLLELFFSGSK